MAVVGLPRMLEEMVQQIFTGRFHVQILSLEYLTSENIHPKRNYAALVTLMSESSQDDEGIRKLLKHHPLSPVICLNRDASFAQMFSLRLEVDEIGELDMGTLPRLVREFSSWYRQNSVKHAEESARCSER